MGIKSEMWPELVHYIAVKFIVRPSAFISNEMENIGSFEKKSNTF